MEFGSSAESAIPQAELIQTPRGACTKVKGRGQGNGGVARWSPVPVKGNDGPRTATANGPSPALRAPSPEDAERPHGERGGLRRTAKANGKGINERHPRAGSWQLNKHRLLNCHLSFANDAKLRPSHPTNGAKANGNVRELEARATGAGKRQWRTRMGASFAPLQRHTAEA